MAKMYKTPFDEALTALHNVAGKAKFPLSKTNLVHQFGDEKIPFGTTRLSFRDVILATPMDYFDTLQMLVGGLIVGLRRVSNTGGNERYFGPMPGSFR